MIMNAFPDSTLKANTYLGFMLSPLSRGVGGHKQKKLNIRLANDLVLGRFYFGHRPQLITRGEPSKVTNKTEP